MKRLLVLAAAVVLGVLLGGFTLVGHTAKTEAAPGPTVTINMSTFPLEPASGVTGQTSFFDSGGVGIPPTIGVSTANGINPTRPFYPAVETNYMTGKNCDPNTTVAVLLHGPGAPDQQLFMVDGVTLGVTYSSYSGTADVAVTTTNGAIGTLTDTRATWTVNQWANAKVSVGAITMYVASNTATILTGLSAWSADPGQGNAYTIALGTSPAVLWLPTNLGVYLGGAASIGSAEIANLVGFNPVTHAYRKADVQHLACGNADTSPVVSPYGGILKDQPPLSNLDTLRIPGDYNGDTVVNTGDLSLAVDMDPTNGTGPCNPVDASAVKTIGSTYQVAICLQASPGEPAGWQFDLVYDDTLNQCVPVTPACSGTGLDCNPDANTGTTSWPVDLGQSTDTPPVGWDCSSNGTDRPKCDTDTATGPAHGRAHISCLTTDTPTLPIGVAVSAPIAMVKYTALAAGSDSLVLDAVAIFNPLSVNILNCPGGPGTCFNGTDVKQAPPPSTATPTATNTATPPPTATATPVPAGVRMEKKAPNGSSNPAVANLWLMKGPCTPANALLGKGCLELDEWIYAIADVDDSNDADNLPEGLGAWENQIRFDHKFISLTKTPDNTWLFSGGRWGGPPVPNPTPGGPDLVTGCYITILSEDNILEGCVSKDDPNTAGIQLGPEGNGLIEKIIIVPNLNDLMFRSDFRPTKDNGIVTDIVDDNCEVTDIYGEQIPGTLPGQLTTVCGDAHITLRFLECDTNLDCQVDVSDDQAEAFRYGSHLGLQLYDRWYDLEPKWSDDDVDIKDLQFCFGRNYSTCQNPIPDDQGTPVPPIDP